ncbi:MAG: hypothetical protein NTW95_04880 [Candidatus Aminicenantes bacterium]|nr:hypothetical protein [Candidatus Aminicenantes bacterium]
MIEKFRSMRMVSPLVIAIFFWMLCFVTWPLEARGGDAGDRKSTEAASVESQHGDGMGMVEKDGAPKSTLKKKGFPWLLVLGGAVVAGVALYFFVFKKAKEELHEDFDSALSDKWLTYHAGNWSVANGFLSVTAPDTFEWESAVYNQAWSSSNFTVTVRLNRLLKKGAYGILLSTDANMGHADGYLFDLFADGTYAIFRENAYQFGPRTSAPNSSWFTIIKTWTTSSAIHDGLDTWNVFKVVRSGSSYSFYANDTLLHTFTDATYDPRYVSVVMSPWAPSTRMDVDYVYVDMGAASAAAIPGTAETQVVLPTSYVDPSTKR